MKEDQPTISIKKDLRYENYFCFSLVFYFVQICSSEIVLLEFLEIRLICRNVN